MVVVGLQDVNMVFDERLVSAKEESSADSVSQLPAVHDLQMPYHWRSVKLL